LLTRLRWLAIVVPVAFVVIVEGLSDTLLDDKLPFPFDTAAVGLVVLAAALLMVTLAFRVIDRLDRQVRERNAELEARNASARALHAMTVAITALADVNDVLATTATDARVLLATDVAWLVLAGSDGEERVVAMSGPVAAFDTTGGQAGDDDRRFVRAEWLRSYLEAPLQRGGSTIGWLAVGTAVARPHGVDDLETLGSLANQAAIAIENDRLQRELRGLAIFTERERIAREMHDGLAQVLGYVNTKSQAVEELLALGRSADAQAQLHELSVAARSIYVDVREAILALSTLPEADGPSGNGHGGSRLAVAVEAYARRFGEAAKLAVSLEAPDVVSTMDLPPEVEANLLRIVQEALTNVRKHAAAQRVLVRFERDAEGLAVTVEDDGRGFDPTQPDEPGDWPHFGRRTIRQRAAAVGGTVRWDSAPGRGTRLRVVVPV
jgi:signal transduction histidine kinase